ncbi:MAG TPA: class I SAM-dependent methyltransferase [Caulobacteraceae bacterium]|jgi:SAM-dependent methyltransferase
MTHYHPQSPDLAPDDLARLRFVAEVRNQLHNRLVGGNRAVYDTQLAQPADGGLHGAAAAARREELRRQMEGQPYFQAWSSMLRSSQDLMWRLVDQAVENDLPRLEAQLTDGEAGASSLELDETLETPAYLLSADTHRMPGSYYRQSSDRDLRAGVLYDLGSAIYQFGRGNQGGGLLNDSRGRTTVAHLRRFYPHLDPARILDLGCSVGQNTLPLADAFPRARVDAIDIGAPMLRYALVRARGLGRAIHFSQRNAEATGFDDQSFDLVVSQILLHETSPQATHNILREAWRLLKPGGVSVHLEVPTRFDRLDVFDQFLKSWEQYYNGEPNTAGVAAADLAGDMKTIGFADVKAGFQAILPPGSDDPAVLLAAPPAGGRSLYVVSGMRC